MSNGKETIDLALDLIDKQLIDSAGRPCGKVEDLELQEAHEPGEGPIVVAILTSFGALGQRLRGPLGRSMHALWRRLRPESSPHPTRIPWEAVIRVDFAVHLSIEREEAGLDLSESWFRDHLISKIPGAR